MISNSSFLNYYQEGAITRIHRIEFPRYYVDNPAGGAVGYLYSHDLEHAVIKSLLPVVAKTFREYILNKRSTEVVSTNQTGG